jgi:type IV pilus assembly protein PilW
MKMHSTKIRRHQHGMTLVELLVALSLSLFLIGGIVQVFAGNRATFAFNEGLGRIQENARFTLDHIAFNARMAGYSGCLADVAVFNNLNGPNTFRDDIASGIQGHDANGTGVGESFAAAAIDPTPSTSVNDWTPALPPELSGLVLPGSDVLVVRGVNGTTHSLITPFTNAAQAFIAGPHDFANGEILVMTDCQKASIFQLTNSTATGSGVNLVHSNSGAFSPGNTAATWPANQQYGLGAEVARLQTFAFFVGRGANNRPSLFQLRLQPLSGVSTGFQAEELVEGIDSMQIRYGEDTDNDGDADTWAPADGVTNWTSVLDLELTVLARAPDEYGVEMDTVVYNLGGTQFDPVDDRRHRQVFSTTVGIRNRLP